MLTQIDLNNWTPVDVKKWLSGLRDDASWINDDYIFINNVGGRKLLLATAQDLSNLGATKVDLQEHILEALESLRYYNSNVTKETLQVSILRLACQSRSLHRQLVAERASAEIHHPPDLKTVTLSNDFTENAKGKQRVSLDTLALVSAIVKTVRQITDILNFASFSKHGDYRSMKSLLLALSIELTSTAQRDQFVERPNDIIEKSSKALSDYCDRIVHGTKDALLIQPFQLEKVKIRKKSNESDLGLIIKSQTNTCIHTIDKITPLSLAKKTNKLNEGDEIIQINQFIIGWSPKNVEKLLNESCQKEDITLMVKKCPSE